MTHSQIPDDLRLAASQLCAVLKKDAALELASYKIRFCDEFKDIAGFHFMGIENWDTQLRQALQVGISPLELAYMFVDAIDVSRRHSKA